MQLPTYRSIATTACFAVILVLAGCAGNIPPATKEDRAPSDPWEPLNRRTGNFNNGVDRISFKPLAKGYAALLPQTMRNGIGNFSKNLFGPMFIVNNFLQGKFRRGFSETGRFLANSTWGILGLVDVGADLGLETYRENFGQTLAVWGVPSGPYVVVPILGPRTLRGAVTIPLAFLTDPSFYIDDDATKWSLYAIRTVDLRARLFTMDAMLDGSYDRYLTIRESYLQNRRFLIFDGDPPEEDDFYDDFYDEDFEEDGEIQ